MREDANLQFRLRKIDETRNYHLDEIKYNDLMSEKYKKTCKYSTALRCTSLSKKTSKKKHLCRHGKNYYYFCKSNIPVINLVVGSRNLIKVSENRSL